MLAYGYRVANNVVYGSSNIEKFTLGGGFFLFFDTSRNDVWLPSFVGSG
jgi:hypothetical protein